MHLRWEHLLCPLLPPRIPWGRPRQPIPVPQGMGSLRTLPTAHIVGGGARKQTRCPYFPKGSLPELKVQSIGTGAQRGGKSAAGCGISFSNCERGAFSRSPTAQDPAVSVCRGSAERRWGGVRQGRGASWRRSRVGHGAVLRKAGSTCSRDAQKRSRRESPRGRLCARRGWVAYVQGCLWDTWLSALQSRPTAQCLSPRPCAGLGSVVALARPHPPRAALQVLWCPPFPALRGPVGSAHPPPGHSDRFSYRHLIHHSQQ